jgi:hypothetical protein
MSTPTPQPWLDSAAAQAVGPVELVCRPRSWVAFRRQPVLLWFLFLVALDLLGAALFLLTSALRGFPGFSAVQDWFAGSCMVLSFTALLLTFVTLWARRISAGLPTCLLLGAKGLAWWTPETARVALWAEMGTVWELDPSPTDADGWVLRRADGVTILLDGRLTDHLAVVARVLAEMPRAPVLVRERTARRASEAIAPEEHGVAEPEA